MSKAGSKFWLTFSAAGIVLNLVCLLNDIELRHVGWATLNALAGVLCFSTFQREWRKLP